MFRSFAVSPEGWSFRRTQVWGVCDPQRQRERFIIPATHCAVISPQTSGDRQ